MIWTLDVVLRLVNAALCVLIAGGLLVDRHSAWRSKGDVYPAVQDRLTASALALVFVWLGASSVDIVRGDDLLLYRVSGGTVLLTFTLVALIVKTRRARMIQRALGPPVQMRTIQDLPAWRDTPGDAQHR